MWLASCCSGVQSFFHPDVGFIFQRPLMKVVRRVIRNQKDLAFVFETKITPSIYFSIYKNKQNKQTNQSSMYSI